MKKFAKGMVSFLMVFMALTLLAPIVHAAEEHTNYEVEVHISNTPVNLEIDEDTRALEIKNPNEEEILNTYADNSSLAAFFKSLTILIYILGFLAALAAFLAIRSEL